jgi:hypothetical protein
VNTKCLPIHSLDELLEKNTYIADPDHPRHLHQEIGERTILGIPPKMGEHAFFHLMHREMIEENKVIRTGPRRSVLALHCIARPPFVPVPGGLVTEDERKKVPIRVHELLKARIISQVHLHPTGDVDWHFLVFRRWARKPSPRGIFRRAMDTIHDEINAGRLPFGDTPARPPLPLMDEVRLRKLAYQGFDPLAQQLALWGPTDTQNLSEALSALGHHLGPGGINEKSNTAHVIHPIHSNSRVFHYNLGRLLEDARRARDYLAGSSGLDADLQTSDLSEFDTPDMDL